MPLKYFKLLAELLDHGQASIFLNEKDVDDEPLAIVNVSMVKEKKLILHITRMNCPMSSILAIMENATLSFISRGDIYIMLVSLEFLRHNHFQVLKVIKAKKHRLRKHFRVDVNIDFSVLCISEIDIKEEITVVKNVGTTNLSAGGFFFYTSERVPVNGLLQITLDLEKYGIIIAKSKIVRCNQVAENVPLFGVAVQFIDISNKEAGRILRFLYSIQRKRFCTDSYKESKQYI